MDPLILKSDQLSNWSVFQENHTSSEFYKWFPVKYWVKNGGQGQKCNSGRYKYLSFQCLLNEIEHMTPWKRYLNTDSGIIAIKTLVFEITNRYKLFMNRFSIGHVTWSTCLGLQYESYCMIDHARRNRIKIKSVRHHVFAPSSFWESFFIFISHFFKGR